MNKRYEGALYEQKAMEYLREKGYKILDHNYYTKFGEIDIIAYKDKGYVFVEVKYRKTEKYGYPYEFVNKTKRERIMKSALAFAKTNYTYKSPMRFDIIDILKDKITHYENAFELDRRWANF